MDKYSKGFNKGIYASIHNEIHNQIGILKKQGLKPCHIYLGRKASHRFHRECWYEYPEEYLGMPITYCYPKLSGVYVVGCKSS